MSDWIIPGMAALGSAILAILWHVSRQLDRANDRLDQIVALLSQRNSN